MTTIAANRDGIASDQFVSDGTYARKLVRGKDFVAGWAGGHAYGTLLAAWLRDGMRGPPPEPREYPGDDDPSFELATTILVVRSSGLTTLDWRGVEMPLTSDYAAIGTGSAAAHGALAMGATPLQAVEIAARYDPDTKAPFEFMTLRSKPRAKR